MSRAIGQSARERSAEGRKYARLQSPLAIAGIKAAAEPVERGGQRVKRQQKKVVHWSWTNEGKNKLYESRMITEIFGRVDAKRERRTRGA